MIPAGLNGPISKFCSDISAKYPNLVFTSGRRSIDDQARVDAQNTVGKRNFIANTYLPSTVRDAVVACCNSNPSADVATLETLFSGILGGFSDDDLSHFSLHLSGNAVDCSPVGDPDLEAYSKLWVAGWIVNGGSARSKVLTLEAGLPRLHVQIL